MVKKLILATMAITMVTGAASAHNASARHNARHFFHLKTKHGNGSSASYKIPKLNLVQDGKII